MKPKNVEFIEEFIEILGGDNFFLCDLLDQEELFTMQDRLAKLICDHANNGTSVARHLVPLLPKVFKVE
jgi:hypothetical protein